jgi:hypothetical protein
MDVIQKLFWLAHLFELDGLKEVLKSQKPDFREQKATIENQIDQNDQEKQKIEDAMNNEEDETSVISFEDAPLPTDLIQKIPKEKAKPAFDFSNEFKDQEDIMDNDKTEENRVKSKLDESSI